MRTRSGVAEWCSVSGFAVVGWGPGQKLRSGAVSPGGHVLIASPRSAALTGAFCSGNGGGSARRRASSAAATRVRRCADKDIRLPRLAGCALPPSAGLLLFRPLCIPGSHRTANLLIRVCFRLKLWQYGNCDVTRLSLCSS